MTYRDPADDTVVQRDRVVERPVDQGPVDDRPMVERERYVERQSVAPAVAPAQQANVNTGYAAPVVATPGPLYYVRRVLGLLFGVLLVLLVLRIVLLALGANAGNGLVDFVYGLTEPFVGPFRGIFSINQVSPRGAPGTFDIAALVAIVGWSLIAALVIAILRIADRDAARV